MSPADECSAKSLVEAAGLAGQAVRLDDYLKNPEAPEKLPALERPRKDTSCLRHRKQRRRDEKRSMMRRHLPAVESLPALEAPSVDRHHHRDRKQRLRDKQRSKMKGVEISRSLPALGVHNLRKLQPLPALPSQLGHGARRLAIT
eukprot:scaffold8059_cov315-Pinguiococcus_pyrenoidosus.AAC.4